MKKIGIVTYVNLNNYGSVLQATALAEYLNSRLFSVEILNIDSKVLIHRLEPCLFQKNIFSFLRNVLLRFKHPIYFYRWFKRRLIFKKFRKKMPYLSKKKISRKLLGRIENEFDYFISGGDQVWNLFNTDGDTRFMLDFINDSNKRKSYSASLGRTFINKRYEKLAIDEIKKFSNVLVREQQSAFLLKNKYGIEAKDVMDPVLLLDSHDWKKFEDKTFIQKNYVLFYSIVDNKEYLDAAQSYAVSINKKLYIINSGFVNFKGKNVVLNTPSPNRFLSVFKNASCAIVASFHGVAFCIIYHIDFICFNFIGEKDPRILNLLKICHLENRLCSNESGFSIDPINWKEVDERINCRRKSDVSLLLEELSDV